MSTGDVRAEAGELYQLNSEPGALYVEDDDQRVRCCSQTCVIHSSCVPCTPRNHNVASGSCRALFDNGDCTPGGFCPPALCVNAARHATDTLAAAGTTDTVLTPANIGRFYPGQSLVVHPGALFETLSVVSVDYDAGTITVTRGGVPLTWPNGETVYINPSTLRPAWFKRTRGDCPKICVQTFNLAPYPLGDYTPPFMKPECIRLLIWCPIERDVNEEYPTVAPTYVYRVLSHWPCDDGNLGKCCDSWHFADNGAGRCTPSGVILPGESSAKAKVCDHFTDPPPSEKPLVWECCDGTLDLRDFGCLVEDSSGLSCYPTGEDLTDLMDQCEDLSRVGEKHMAWALVEYYSAYVREWCPADNYIPLGFSHGEVLAWGNVRAPCPCTADLFTCEDSP